MFFYPRMCYLPMPDVSKTVNARCMLRAKGTRGLLICTRPSSWGKAKQVSHKQNKKKTSSTTLHKLKKTSHHSPSLVCSGAYAQLPSALWR